MVDIQLPDYLKDLTDNTAKDMITRTGGVPRISIRGRQFRFIIEGEEIHKQTEPIHVVILGIVPEQFMAKTFYIDGYQPGSTDPPDCSSFFGIEPDSWVSSPQSVLCRDCDQNKWGSAVAMNGKKAKACKDSKRLMVINTADLKTEETPIVYIFNVTIASLKALSTYGKFLLTHKLPMAAVITKIEFVDAEFPQVDFIYTAILNQTIGMKMLERASEKEWLLNMDNQPALPAPAGPMHPQLAKPQAQPAQQTTQQPQTQQVAQQPQTQQTDLQLTQAVQQPQTQQTVQQPTQPVVDNSLKDLTTDELLKSW